MGHDEKMLLTQTELRFMNVVWAHCEVSVSQVQQELHDYKSLAYTSVATILRILEKKGAVKSEKRGRSFFYSAVLSRKTYERTSLDHLIDNVFDNSPQSLVKRLVDGKGISRDELTELKSIIERELT